MLFGSQARGDAEPDSDIDVMVVLNGEVDPVAESRRVVPISAEISLTHGVVITCIYVLIERFNVLVTRSADSTSIVRVIRYVKARAYNMVAGPKGSWTPASNQDFVQKESITIPEWRLLNAVEQCLRTGTATVGDLDRAE